MRESSQIFCSVCRRKGIQTLDDYVCGTTSFKFTNLLIRDDSESWQGKFQYRTFVSALNDPFFFEIFATQN